MAKSRRSAKGGRRGRDDAADEEPTSASAPLSFESALERLEGSIARLEEGEMPLEDALELFESGVKLSRQCQATLDEAQHRVEILVADRAADPDAPKSVAFEPDEDSMGDEATSSAAAADENGDDGDDDKIEDEE